MTADKMTSTYRGENELSRRTTATSIPESVDTEESMSSDFDEKVPYQYEGRSVIDDESYNPTPKKPLIQYITNEWQTNPRNTRTSMTSIHQPEHRLILSRKWMLFLIVWTTATIV